MPRAPRVLHEGITQHVVQRGHDRGDCFFSDGDRTRYLRLLSEHAERLRVSVHAYCLMSNHIHLLLTPDRTGALSDLMKSIGERYVQAINRTRERSGTLWEGRFHASPVENASYVMACYRYIEANPVRAGIVVHPRDYVWSSYRSNAHHIHADGLISPHAEYLALAPTNDLRQTAYRDLFDDVLNAQHLDAIRAATIANRPLGGSAFVAMLEQIVGRRMRTLKAGRPRRGASGSDPNSLSAAKRREPAGPEPNK